MLYIEVVPRGAFSYYLGIMILLSFVCSGIGQLTSVIFNKTEYAYLCGTIIALLSCLLSGFSPTKEELGLGQFIVTLYFSHMYNHYYFVMKQHTTLKYLAVLEKIDGQMKFLCSKGTFRLMTMRSHIFGLFSLDSSYALSPIYFYMQNLSIDPSSDFVLPTSAQLFKVSSTVNLAQEKN